MQKYAISSSQFGMLAIQLFLPVLAAQKLGATYSGVNIWFYAALLLFSLLCYSAMAYDKIKAINGDFRVPEAYLHLLELCGGWPGSSLAQQRFRHKTRKMSYQLTFYGVIALFQLVAWLILDEAETVKDTLIK